MKIYFFKSILLIACIITRFCTLQAQPTASTIKPDTSHIEKIEPVIFVPGIIPTTVTNNADAAFSPDGRTLYLYQSVNRNSVIVESHLVNGKWTAPVVAPFSGVYHDLEEAFSPDGKYMVFASSRPVTPDGKAVDGHYDGMSSPGDGGNIWKISRTKNGWGKPELLPQNINSNTSVFSPNVAANGNLYFMRSDSGREFHLYLSKMENGVYQTPELFPFNIPGHGDYDPAIAADESFMIFSSRRSPAPAHTADLFIVFRTQNGWSDPIDLRILSPNVHGIEARLSPDNKTLYFSNARNPSGVDEPGSRYLWQVDISDVLKAHGVMVE